MSIYRKIYCQSWNAFPFRELSRPQPNAQSLVIYLTAGPFTTTIPGVVPAGKAALAEALDWDSDGFLRVFAELETHAIATADWSARLVFLPSVVNDNKPENPNVVKAWRKAYEELPDCSLKAAIKNHVEAFLEDFQEDFREAWREPSGKPLPNPSRNPLPNPSGNPSPNPSGKRSPNQNQEQNHKQQQNQKQKQNQKVSPEGEGPLSDLQANFRTLCAEYPNKFAQREAREPFLSLRPSPECFQLMLNIIEEKKQSEWQHPKSIPTLTAWVQAFEKGERTCTTLASDAD